MSENSRVFGAESTTDEVVAGLDLTGKRAVVTGASGGLGAEAARALASIGAEVVLTARDLAKAEGVAEGIRSSTGNGKVSVMELSLDSQDSVRAFAESFLGKYDSLNILLNNAGVMACPLQRTKEGYEYQF
ncbi:short-chain alcohol dehydrogenase, partial [Moorena producens 3L]